MKIYKIKEKHSLQIVTYNKNLCKSPWYFEVIFFGELEIDEGTLSTIYELRGKAITDLISSAMYSSSCMIVSEKLKILLEKLNCPQFQFIPINITKKDVSIGNYFLFHFVKTKEYLDDLVDWNNTTFEMYKNLNEKVEKHLIEIKSLVDLDQINLGKIRDEDYDYQANIKLKKIPQCEIFNFNYRLFPIGFYCTENLKELIEKEGITGIQFEEVTDFEY